MGSVKLDTSTDPQVGFRPPGPLDAAPLAAFDDRFTVRHAAHLLRRGGFGGTAADVAHAQSLGMHGAVDALLHPIADDVAFADYPANDVIYNTNGGLARSGTQTWWLDRMLRTKRPLVEKMTLFWHGHFATSIDKVPAALMAEQIALFRAQGLGNFRNLLASVSVDPAMSIWLDNRYNTKAHPNENYAREVMELFALGLGNYTEDDVKNAARAFTGWAYDGKAQRVAFNPKLHDDGPKTFLGRTGAFGLQDIIAIIVSQPVHQRFIARALLEFFLYSDPEPELIEGLAQTYALGGYDIAKTMGTLLRSNVFYSTRAYRAIPKSPIEFAIGLLRYAGTAQVPASLPNALRRMGQEPLAPPSVKGWDGGPAWINTNTLLARFNYVNALAAQAPPKADAPNIQPDAIVAQAGGFDAPRVVETIVASALQDDVTRDVRETIVGYLTQSDAVGAMFGPENYQQKIRGAVALTLNLPVNQLN